MSDLPELTGPQGPAPSPAAGEGGPWHLKDLNDSQLQAVLKAPPNLFPEQRLANEVARKKATQLLDQIDELF